MLALVAIGAIGCGCTRAEPGLASSKLNRVALAPAQGALAVGSSEIRPILLPGTPEFDALAMGDDEFGAASD